MSAQHTPGPWEITGFSDCQLITKDVPPALGQPLAIGRTYGPDQIANARLIAAAPELLEALEECAFVLKAHKINDRVRDVAASVIAKAKGGTS
jgi:hypothetical protein